jgi:micrococcal nuclease
MPPVPCKHTTIKRYRPPLLLLVAAVLLLLAPLGAAQSNGRASATVLAVIDGDTLRVQLDGERELVRLIGIDTPESRANHRATMQAERNAVDENTILELGARASRAVSQMVAVGSGVEIEFDVERRDRYGRLLGYVYGPDGAMLNERILQLGYAQLLTVPPNVRYVQRLRTAFEAGRSAQRGLWSAPGFTSSRPQPPQNPILPHFRRR